MYKLLFIAALLYIVSSCNTHKKIIYFQENISSTDKNENYTPKFKTDDLLSILISGDELETSAPFNLTLSSSIQALNSGYSIGNIERNGYLLDEKGEVNIPVLGKVNLLNLSREEAIQLITEKLNAFISNPIVNIQILNFKITVLGDVNRPGTFKIPNERITLLEAIGLSGDLKISGNRKNILVVRDNGGKKEEFRIDLTSAELFNSNVYYLEQNDVVYIEPNLSSRNNSTVWKTSGSIFISSISLLLTSINILLIK